MVVCMVVRIRNDSSTTFTITQAGDPFYTPKVGGQACGDEPFQIEPGLDAATEGLVVPWAATTRTGLVVGQADGDESIRCVVGPSDLDDAGHDWLRLHESTWEPLAQERWLALGKRHLLGTVGGVVELQLTFREPRGAPPRTMPVPGDTGHGDEIRQGSRVRLQGLMVSTELNGEHATCMAWDESERRWTVQLENGEMRAVKKENLSHLEEQDVGARRRSVLARSIADSTHFERESACAPVNTVFLNVYDLASAASIPNQLLCNSVVKTLGAFHAAVEVYGEEWGFYRQPNPDDCGICRSRQPRRHPVHVYRQSVNLGKTKLRDWEVWNLIRWEIIPNWPSKRYDLIRSNCIHFCEEMLQHLGADPVPAWVKGLHETGAALLKVPWPLSLIYSGGDAISAVRADRHSGEIVDVAGSSQADNPPHGAASAAPDDPATGTSAEQLDAYREPRRPDFLPKGSGGAVSRSSSQESFASLDPDERRGADARR